MFRLFITIVFISNLLFAEMDEYLTKSINKKKLAEVLGKILK